MTSVYVPKFYEMDPEFDDLIFGTELREGMVVLLESSFMRGDPDKAFAEGRAEDDYTRYEVDRCRETARWATVTNLHVTPRVEGGPLIRFMALYADGTKSR